MNPYQPPGTEKSHSPWSLRFPPRNYLVSIYFISAGWGGLAWLFRNGAVIPNSVSGLIAICSGSCVVAGIGWLFTSHWFWIALGCLAILVLAAFVIAIMIAAL
jgi:hypothetical protein